MGKRYSGVREIEKGETYEVNYQINGARKQYRVKATSEQEAYLKKVSDIAEYQKSLSLPEEEQRRLTADFREAWEKVRQDIASDNVGRKGAGRYHKVFERMFIDFRNRHFSQIQNPNQLTSLFFKDYKNYYVNGEVDNPKALPHTNGWRSELIIVKAIVRRLYQLGYCAKKIVDELGEFKKPPKIKKEYPNISKSDIEKYLSHVKKDRPDYYRPTYFMYRTGRRREEVTLIKKSDVILNGLEPVAINIRAETTKTKVRAPLRYLDEDLKRLIMGAMSNNKTEWLFANRCGRKCDADQLYKYIKRTSMEIMSIEITPHYFRRRFLTECGKANAHIADVQAISGIKDVKVIMEHYAYSTVEGQQKVLEITRI